ncbi:MAG: hypothetical protein AAGF01_00625 [Cyanobacteria bacterium P01_G01_bin.38]
MTSPDSGSPSPIWNSLPDDVQGAVLTYVREAELPPQSVIEFVIARFLELDTPLSEDRAIPTDDTSLLAELPPSLQTRMKQYASEIEVPPEFVIELAIAHFLDPDSVTFDDCRVRVQSDLVEWLKQLHKNQAATAS